MKMFFSSKLKLAYRNYKELFPTIELQINVPLLFVFFFVSVVSLFVSPFYLTNQEYQNSALYYLLVPPITYGSLLLFVIFKSKKIISLLNAKKQGLLNPREARKSKLTQALTILMILIASFGFFDSLSWWLQANEWASDGIRLATISIFVIVALIGTFISNIRSPTIISRSIFIAFSIIIFSFVDTPEQTINGRSFFLQLIPIFISSFLISPNASFITLIISFGLLSFRSVSSGIGFNSPGYLGLLFITTIIWIISDGWEKAINDYEKINKTLERKVYRRTLQLSEANSFKSKFLAQISHEMQSPIIVFSLFLRKIGPLVEKEEYTALTNEAERILEMTKSISMVAKIELDLLNIESIPKKIDPRPILLRASQGLKLIADDKDIQIHNKFLEENSLIFGHTDFIYRISQNLIGNAIKYSPEGSEIFIIQCFNDYRYSISINDHGVGIPSEELPFIFDRFTRASNVGDAPGTGLGLSMVKEMVEAMHGTITVESELGIGTTVTVTFPLAD